MGKTPVIFFKMLFFMIVNYTGSPKLFDSPSLNDLIQAVDVSACYNYVC